jgi:hypothetical protein
MGAPTLEVVYTSATTKRRYHEVYMDVWWYLEKNPFGNMNMCFLKLLYFAR